MKRILILPILLFGCATRQPASIQYKYVIVTNASTIAVVSDETPDPYTHNTTHPNQIARDLSIDIDKGHVDGGEYVSFAGKVVCIEPDGVIVPITNAYFHLLFPDQKEALPFTTDINGDFRGVISVWAAYGYVKGKTNEMALYQTTTAPVAVKAPGYEMQKVNVRYRQPSTLIIMKRIENGQQGDGD